MIESRKVDDHCWMGIARLLTVLAVPLWVAAAAPAAFAADCSPAGRVNFICGVTNVEDFAPAPDTKWVIGSDLSTPGSPQGYLYLFDTGKKIAVAVQPSKIAIRPDKKTYPHCPGPVDMRTFGPHGLDLTQAAARTARCMPSTTAAGNQWKCSPSICRKPDPCSPGRDAWSRRNASGPTRWLRCPTAGSW